MEVVEGVVFLAQEDRFQLLDREGAGHWFVLSRSPRSGIAGALPCPSAGARVRVFCTGAGDALESVAHKVARLGGEALDEAPPPPDVNRHP